MLKPLSYEFMKKHNQFLSPPNFCKLFIDLIYHKSDAKHCTASTEKEKVFILNEHQKLSTANAEMATDLIEKLFLIALVQKFIHPFLSHYD